MDNQNHEVNERLSQLAKLLGHRLRNWTFPPGVSADEVVTESIEALWKKESTEKQQITSPLPWLTVTAKHKKLEKSRECARISDLRDAYLKHSPLGTAAAQTRRRQRVDFTRFGVWTGLSPAQQHALTECIMFERGVTDVARELGVNRSTVNGWIMRIPKRLARDPQLQSLLN